MLYGSHMILIAGYILGASLIAALILVRIVVWVIVFFARLLTGRPVITIRRRNV
jgi:hypothetical protein